MNQVAIIKQEQVAEALWRWLEQAADSPSHPIRLMTLATLDQAGHPDARLMVLRGADRDSGHIWMHTNPDTYKLRHVRKNPRVCLVAYDPNAGVQIRLYGRATVHTQGRIQKQHVQQTAAWLSNYDSAQKMNHNPQSPLDPRSDAFLALPPEERSATIRASTAIIDIHLATIDWQQIAGGQLRRFAMRAGDNWTPTVVDRTLINTTTSDTNPA